MDLLEEPTMVPSLKYAAAREIRQIDLALRPIRVPEPDLSPFSGFDLKRSNHSARHVADPQSPQRFVRQGQVGIARALALDDLLNRGRAGRGGERLAGIKERRGACDDGD